MGDEKETGKALLAGAILGALIAGPEGAAGGALVALILKELEKRK